MNTKIKLTFLPWTTARFKVLTGKAVFPRSVYLFSTYMSARACFFYGAECKHWKSIYKNAMSNVNSTISHQREPPLLAQHASIA